MEILVAEDELSIAYSYRIALEDRGHGVKIANDGDECIQIYKEKLKFIEGSDDYSNIKNSNLPFDIVILDYKMPNKNGLEVAKEIFSLVPNQRIIFASAYVKSTLEESLRHLDQVVEVLQKPFDVKALIDTIEDKEITDGLKILMASLRQIEKDEIKGKQEVSEDHVRYLFEGLRKIQKGRTF